MERQQQLIWIWEKIIGSTLNNSSRLDAEVVVQLKYLSNFWRSLDLLLINFEIELDLSWPKDCIISEIWRTPEKNADLDANPPFSGCGSNRNK